MTSLELLRWALPSSDFFPILFRPKCQSAGSVAFQRLAAQEYKKPTFGGRWVFWFPIENGDAAAVFDPGIAVD